MSAERLQAPDLPHCTSDEIEASIAWHKERGKLTGRLIVRNVGTRTCLVAGKPVVQPLGMSGDPLHTRQIVSLELRIPGWVTLTPGARAAAPVSWGGWCGEPASGRVHVRWHSGEATVVVEEPKQPDCQQPENLSSSWFSLIDEPP